MAAHPPTEWTEVLPDPLPENPLVLAATWLAEARADRVQPNPNAMILATTDTGGQPSARVVLCKDIDPAAGTLSFYTNYESRKGRELQSNPQVAIVFHWDYKHRQIRVEGRAEALSAAENDAYFRTRPWRSRLGAWASRQSEPLTSRADLQAAVAATARRFGISYEGPGRPEPAQVLAEVPRPPHWGGFKVHVAAIELWVEGEFRIHDRVRWTRRGAGDPAPHWSAARLQP